MGISIVLTREYPVDQNALKTSDFFASRKFLALRITQKILIFTRPRNLIVYKKICNTVKEEIFDYDFRDCRKN